MRRHFARGGSTASRTFSPSRRTVNIAGGPWRPASIATLFRTIAKRAELGHLRFHDLRHICASLLIDAGFPITTVAQIMGHASAAVTASIYAHAIPKTSETLP